MKTRILMPLLLFMLAAPLAAQQPAAPKPVDRILAVVGDSIIFENELKGELDARVATMQANGDSISPQDTAAIARMRRELLDEMVDRLVLVQAALRDSTIVLDETELNAQVEQEINDRRQRIGGAAAFEAALRQQMYSLNEFRDYLMSDLRKQMLTEHLLQRQAQDRKPPPISDKELREEFEKQKSRFPPRPPTISFQQVVLVPRASDSAQAAARAKADSLLTELRTGADFATLAKLNSDDSGSKESGGELGWARPSTFVKEFADAIMYLLPGQISPVVETTYGYHIIKLEKVRGAERQARHILIAPTTAEGDDERGLVRGREVAEKIRAGADVDSLHRAIGDAAENSRQGPLDRTKLPQSLPAYDEKLGGARVGDVIGPFIVTAPQKKFVVLKVTEVRESGEYTIDDPVLNFRRNLEQRRLIAEIIDELRGRTHIEIRP